MSLVHSLQLVEYLFIVRRALATRDTQAIDKNVAGVNRCSYGVREKTRSPRAFDACAILLDDAYHI
jgi:hypothetical protein